MKARTSFVTKIVTAFSATVLVVVLLLAGNWKVTNDATQAADWVAHTHEVLNGLSKIKADTLQIELATQSFRISGDQAHWAERNTTVQAREQTLARIKNLTRDQFSQQQYWQQLRAVLNQRLAISQQVQHIRETQGADAANAFIAKSPIRETRVRTYRILREMEAKERQLLAERQQQLLRNRQIMQGTELLVAFFLTALLIASYILIRRQLREKEASQAALRQSEESLSITLHSIGDAVLATDTAGCVTTMNPVAERLTGWTIAEAKGQPIDDVFFIINEFTQALQIAPVAQVLATGQTQELANHTVLIARDGSHCPIADSAAPIRDREGQICGVVLVFRDVTVEKQMQSLIREQNALLEQRVEEKTRQLHESEGHLHDVMNSVPALIAFVDPTQHYVYVNRQYHERFAPYADDMTGMSVQQALGDEMYAIAAPMIERALQGEPQNYDLQVAPGIWLAITYTPKKDAQGRVLGYYATGVNINARKLAENNIQALNTQLEQHIHELEHVSRALRTLSAGNHAMLRASKESDLLKTMCKVIVEIGGYRMAIVWYRTDDAELRAMADCGDLAAWVVPKDPPTYWLADAQAGVVASAIHTGQVSVARQLAHAETSAISLSTLACPLFVDGAVIGALAIYDLGEQVFDADEIKLLSESAADLAFGVNTLRARAAQQRTQSAMYHLTHYDALTGLPNETHFTELLTAAIGRSLQFNQSFAVLQTNIERLSEINDALGFSYGDQLLQEFGMRICNALPRGAMVARLRGDEFAVLLPDCDEAAALSTVQDIAEMTSYPFVVADIPIEMAAKIGITLCPEHGDTPHDLYRHMDIAVHLAKKKGIGHIVFDPEKNQGQSHRSLVMASELRRAIENGDLRLYLQPKVDMASGRVCGAEGLIRWQHATHGLIPPNDFISLAENTGLIKPITEWVIETALRLNHDWAGKACALALAVNLSARNFREDNLLERIGLLQEKWPVATGLLELEITESTVMDNAEFALGVLHRLREQGIPLCIDDFGTGYSSLSYLQKLPVDYIKIDQSFVRDMLQNRDAELIVRSTIELVHALGRKTIAEGVETQESWDMLARLGCDIVQGYFIAKPMPAEELPRWIAHYQATHGMAESHQHETDIRR
ncbi:EAL domain-containing protein [Chitinibacter sp. S2-10]|uniref:EAL domain-containing protein n=1 Tax=Chitinibacter sp. S2-10 TaxID=3373597 RepID=UPI00397790ED